MVSTQFLSPKDFEVNEAWIVIRATDQPFLAGSDLCDCYVMMDAGSCYIFGHVLVMRGQKPDKDEVEQLLQDAWILKKQWAKRLIITEDSATTDLFTTKAKEHGLSMEGMPASSLLPIVGPMKEGFAELMLNQGA